MKSEITELGMTVETQTMLRERGHYSAVKFRREHPAKWDQVIVLLTEGWSKNAIAKTLGIAWETVDAIAADPNNAPAIREVSLRTKHRSGQIVEAGLDHLLDKAVAGKLGAFDVKLVHDIHQLSAGLPTAIVEQRQSVSPEEWAGVLARLNTGSAEENKSAMDRGPVVEVSAEVVVGNHQ